jgi:hypothetical protein
LILVKYDSFSHSFDDKMYCAAASKKPLKMVGKLT